MFISNDGGNSWSQWNEGLTNSTPATNGNNVTNMLSLSADNSILYFGSAGSGVFRRMITPILPVNNVSAQTINGEVVLYWRFDDLNKNFNSYNVYKSTQSFSDLQGLSPIASISDVNDTTFTDIQVDSGVHYYYAVTTVDINSYENPHFYVLGPVVLSETSVIENSEKKIPETTNLSQNYPNPFNLNNSQIFKMVIFRVIFLYFSF